MGASEREKAKKKQSNNSKQMSNKILRYMDDQIAIELFTCTYVIHNWQSVVEKLLDHVFDKLS